MLKKLGRIATSAPPGRQDLIGNAIVALVDFCVRFTWLVILVAVALTVAGANYAATHFRINANTNQYLASGLPWQQRAETLDKAFPQLSQGQILIVLSGATPELAERAAAEVAKRLSGRLDLFKLVERPGGDAYLDRKAFLFQSVSQLKDTMSGLLRAEPFLSILTADPSLRGVMDAFALIPEGVRGKAATFDEFDRPMAAMSQALQNILAGRPAYFSWRTLLSNQKPSLEERQRFIIAQAVLNYSGLQPGRAASNFIRENAQELGLAPANGVSVQLTGRVPIADQEFVTLEEGWGLNGTIAGFFVLFFIWSALRSFRIVAAVALTVVMGLSATAAVGLMMVKALNLISIAFAVLFVGIGTDFGIQFSVRYRAERYEEHDVRQALHLAAEKAGRPLGLAAAATTAGFYSFLPTDYRGISELGLIAGTGMIIAFFSSVSVLPGLLRLFGSPVEWAPVGFKFLAPLDAFLVKHRLAIVIGTLAVALAGTRLLAHLSFDFNPINLSNPHNESVATLRKLMAERNSPVNRIEILAPSLAAANRVADTLQKLPEVSQVVTLKSFVPLDQDQKLPLIKKAAAILLPLFNLSRAQPPPNSAEEATAIKTAAHQFSMVADHDTSRGAAEASHLAELLQRFAAATPEKYAAARTVFLPSLHTMLDLLHQELQANKTTFADIPE